METAGCFDLRRRGIAKVDGQVNAIIGLTSRLTDCVTTAPDIQLGFDPSPDVVSIGEPRTHCQNEAT